MLRSLSIENFALIDEANIEFDKGFTVITGETGSGKSILLNALNLILGERANFSVIGKLKDKSVVEGVVDLSGFDVSDFFEKNELDYFDNTILRREIYKQGRSRAFINDVPVQLSVLKELSSRLIHIHSQYNTLELKDLAFQLDVLDILAGTRSLRQEYSDKYLKFRKDEKQLEDLQSELIKLTSTADYNTFQLQELELLNLDSVDYEEMRSQLRNIENAEDLMKAFAVISESLNGDGGILEQFNRLNTVLNSFKIDHKRLDELKERIDAIVIESKDIAETAADELDLLETDPQKLQELSQRLDEFNRLMHKHHISSQEDLISYRDSLMNESNNTVALEEKILELKTQIETTAVQLKEMAKELHRKRVQAVPDIERTIESALQGLKLKDTRLLFDIKQSDSLLDSGITKLEMLFSPNAGIDPVPIHQAASGGELSRLMLTLQNLISGKMKLQTILFDEIDTGVSGDVAQKIGETLKKMGQNMQVIAITHLPQVAAKGGQHLRVNKSIEEGQTKSTVIELKGDERVSEIARLMSGDEITAAAIENAKSLMS